MDINNNFGPIELAPMNDSFESSMTEDSDDNNSPAKKGNENADDQKISEGGEDDVNSMVLSSPKQ